MYLTERKRTINVFDEKKRIIYILKIGFVIELMKTLVYGLVVQSWSKY